MSNSILVPLDGSAHAERALPYASGQAGAGGKSLVLLRVLTPRPPRGEELVHVDAVGAHLNVVAEGLRSQGLTVETVVSSALGGPVAPVITVVAQRHSCELIVMSTHGRSGPGRWLYGSVAEDVLRTAPIPVLLVPPTTEPVWRTEGRPRVLVSLDGSPAAEEAA